MVREYEFGLNVLEKMFIKGLEEHKCDRLDCMAFNINLDYVLRLLKKYTLSKVNLYSNSEHVHLSDENREEILELLTKGSISFYHISENYNVIHSKVYRFWKNDEIVFGAIGSPNLTDNSNQNFESLLYIYDNEFNTTIWDQFLEICELYEIPLKTEIPSSILSKEGIDREIDERYLEELWEHQKVILKWLAKRYTAIVNIPTGTGKTKIALSYLDYLFDTEKDLTSIILVPTTTLIEQWKKSLESEGISCFEMGTDLSNLDDYFGDPSTKAVITLYSRFFSNLDSFSQRLRIIRPNTILIADECHNIYPSLAKFSDFANMSTEYFEKNYVLALSATIDNFRKDLVSRFIDLMGGEDNRFIITIQSYYSNWNDKNETPTLKPLKYTPISYRLSDSEMKEYNKLTRYVAASQSRKNVSGEENFAPAIKRARWVRELNGGVQKLKEYIQSHIEEIDKTNTLIFVQTNSIAEELRDFLVKQKGWDGSAYVYDSSRSDKYRNYAMEQFRKNKGFCLFSEQMLSEGYDLPKISRIILHGSHKSQRDWLQKIGRALRYDPEYPKSIAYITDIVFCRPNGEPLSIEEERFNTIKSISL